MGLVLIDKILVFDEDNFLLFRADADGEEPLRLGAIASRCLAMLLRSDNAVVRKRDLMAGAWGQYGLEVTDNSLAQVVRQLRLALEKMQPDREFIQTLPRIGYKLTDNVQVEELAANAPVISTVRSAMFNNDGEIPVSPASSLADTTLGDTGPSLLKEAQSYTSPSTLPALLQQRWGLWLALLLWGALTFLLGRAWQAPPLDAPLIGFSAPVTMNNVNVYLPADKWKQLPTSYLQATVLRSQKLAEIMGIPVGEVHLYLLTSGRESNQILCDGKLEAANSRCIGVQLYD
ncbi:winged helix-turn-helix domain-containing protein [Pseudomonas tussilaginis]|uniref:winged helix-turn-helix domain-containing protein n=1 Tax=unclassified Pseudomonas TaxID=196821 RepID=UPI000C6EE6FB|nr:MULTISPECIES: winged helix-turn-helix domain-containing protein [unclassified Pseudomonas]QYX47742.1 winged helix-turn-helix domain-containing protein [Pseudomonas sp. S11A 273]